MSIRTKLSIMLGIVLVLHISTALMGHIGLERAQADLQASEDSNADTIRILEIDKTIAELQRNVASFMLTGNAGVADRVRELQADARGHIARAKAGSSEPGVLASLREMDGRIEAYGSDFEKVIADRAFRNRLVQGEMIPAKEEILARVAALPETGPASRTTRNSLVAELLQAESDALRYFDQPNRTAIDNAVEHLANASRDADEIRSPGAAAAIGSLLAEYERSFLDAVQATRGYLHLVNVVLAGEASELYFMSTEIRRRSLEERASFLNATRAGARRFQYISDAVALLTIIVGVVTASVMMRSVLRPILRITETFRRLAAGDRDATIDGQTRTDEIGQMSSAAEVFRIKNIETQALLDRSRVMQKDLERRNEEMSQFVYTVSHDLKSPIVTLRGYSGVLSEAIDAGDPDEMRQITGRIYSAAGRMASTVEDLLDLSSIGIKAHEFRRVRLDETCRDVLQDLQGSIDGSGATVAVSLGPGASEIHADSVQLRQVLQNLIQNAINYGVPEHGCPDISITAQRQGDRVVLSVSDNGPGIPQRHHERIFGIFQRLATDDSGSGIGLAIVKKIAELHGGHAEVRSGEGEGATFSVSFPASRSYRTAA